MLNINVFEETKLEATLTPAEMKEKCIFCSPKEGQCKALKTLQCAHGKQCRFFRDKNENYIRTVNYAGNVIHEYVTEEEAKEIDKRRGAVRVVKHTA